MSLLDHPGFLGCTSRGVIAIHADWPAYAIEHGAAYALERLGQFPVGTRFFAIDDIDQCLLLRVDRSGEYKDDFDHRLFHVALWHEDILDLFSNAWVEGVSGLTPRQWAINRCDELRQHSMRLADGRLVPLPDPDDFDDTMATIALISKHGMQVTSTGFEELAQILTEQFPKTPVEILARVEPLIGIRAYGAAIREACVILESHVRSLTDSNLFGNRLIEKYCGDLQAHVIESHVKWLRTELRSCFSFVRNDFMHNLRDLSETQCLALLTRVGTVYRHLVEASGLTR